MAGEAISKALLENPSQVTNPPLVKKKRNLPGTPDPDAEVIALSPKTLLATNRFLCEICGKGFQRDQNLQLHRRGHNLPWKLRQKTSKEQRKRVYVCPEKNCVHHNPSRALGDLTGIKKHFCRKHGEKKWKCDKCSKRYAVQSDWKAHSKTCGTREYRCDCGTLFSRRDSFITHRAFCDALAAENARICASNNRNLTPINTANYHFTGGLMRSNMVHHFPSSFKNKMDNAEATDSARAGLSLWMGQRPQNGETLIKTTNLLDSHQAQSLSMSNHMSNPFAPSSGGQQLDCQLSWIYGNKLNSSSSGDKLISPPPMSSMKEADGSNSILLSVPSLYSTQLYHQTMSTPADISATALLQKAAQIGATSSCPTFPRSFEMKRHDIRAEDCYELDTLLHANHPSLATNLQSSLQNAVNDFTASDPFTALYSTRHCMVQKDDLRVGETRDFLGVGVQSLCASSLNGWI